MSLVRYELGFCIAEDSILHSHRRENLKFYIPPCQVPRGLFSNRTGIILMAMITLNLKQERSKNGVFWVVTP
jgi:hypothetical protein